MSTGFIFLYLLWAGAYFNRLRNQDEFHYTWWQLVLMSLLWPAVMVTELCDKIAEWWHNR